MQTRTFEELKARPKGTRRGQVRIRMALNSEGEQVHRLVQAAGFTIEGLDWSRIAPYWLVADLGGDVVGCIQVCLSVPIGRIEMLSVDRNLSQTMRAHVVWQLVLTAATTLKRGGAQMACGMITFDMKGYKRLLKRRGCVSLGAGNQMAKLLI